jgi:hypothetical protein
MVARETVSLWIIAVVVCLFAATAINLSWVQRHHNADSLLFALISIDHETPFYWGENRLGVPGALAASVIRDYTANLFAQTALMVASSIGCVIAFNIYFLHSSLSWVQRMAAGLLSITLAIGILSGSPTAVRAFAVGGQPYTQSLFLVLLGTALIFRMRIPWWARLPGLALCALLAFWINISIAALSFGLILCVDFRRPNPQWLLRVSALFIVAAAAIADHWFAKHYSGPSMLKVQGLHGWVLTVRTLWHNTGPYYFKAAALGVFLMSFLAIVLVQLFRRRVIANYLIDDAIVFCGGAIALALSVARLEWVKANGYDPRYWCLPLTIIVLLVTAWVSSAIVRTLSAAGSEALALKLTAGLLLACVIGVFGFPSYARAKSYLAEEVNRYDQDERTLGCTHLLGDYWAGWTSVFQRESSGGPPIYAITLRSEAIRERWDWSEKRPRTYCGFHGDPTREIWRRSYGLPQFRETAHSGELCRLEILRP